MAYFSNGTEGCDYIERYCINCNNWRDKDDGRGPGCAVWDAHLLFSYQECNNDGVDGPRSNAKSILDMLIPQGDDGFAGECEMFLEREDAP